jgi:hypothetical protein
MSSIDLAFRLRIIRRCPHMGHLTELEKPLEILGNVLWSIIRDEPRKGMRKQLSSPLKNYLNILLCHGFTNFPVNNQPRTAFKKSAQGIILASDSYKGDVGVPILVRLKRLIEVFSFTRLRGIPALKPTRLNEHLTNAGRACCNNV